MANPNPEVYGAPETWQGAYNASGINSEAAENLKCGKIKIPNFSSETGTYITSQLRTAVSNNKITANTPIDNSICAVGQGYKSPYKQIACHYYDEENKMWFGPYVTIIDAPINMFPYETYSTNGLQGIGGGATNLNFETTGSGQTQIWSENGLEYKQVTQYVTYYNANWRIAPFTRYQLKSIVLQVYVNYTTNTSFPVTDEGLNDDHWVTLDDWKNTYNNYPIVGCKVRMTSANHISGDDINYFNYVGDNNPPYRSAFGLGLNHPVIHNSSGDKFLSYTTFKSSQINSDVIIFDKQYNLSGWGKYSKLCLPMWDKFSEYCYKPSNKVVFYRIPYSNDVYEQLMQAVASLGFCFTPTAKTTFNKSFTDVDMCIPVINDDGVTTGDYTRGTDNPNNDLYNADSVRDKNYNPSQPVDPNTYSNQTVFNVIGAGASMNKRYLLDAANVNKLATDLFTICDTMSQDDDYSFFDSKVKANMLTQSPIESIVSLIRYPFTPTHGSTKQTVKLGRFDASAEGYPLSNAIQTITFDGKTIFPRFENCFLDYEPYTKYEVYVPFCDTVELSAADILGHTLNIRLVVDLFTGVCTGYILADSLCIETTTGNVGVNLPLTGLDTATINANIANAEANKKAAKKNYIKGHFDIITQKDKVGALWTQILGTNEDVVKKADYDLKHIETPMHTIGAASPVTSWAMDLNARIMIYYPTGDAVTNSTPPELRDLSTYAHTTGFATIDNALLSNYSGFTVATNAILNFAATTTEKDMIESALNGGIFI